MLREYREDIYLLPMDRSVHFEQFDSDLLSFVVAAVSKVQMIVAELLTTERRPEVRETNRRKLYSSMFVPLLDSLLADVQANLSQICSTGAIAIETDTRRKILLLLEALENLVNVGPELLSLPSLPDV